MTLSRPLLVVTTLLLGSAAAVFIIVTRHSPEENNLLISFFAAAFTFLASLIALLSYAFLKLFQGEGRKVWSQSLLIALVFSTIATASAILKVNHLLGVLQLIIIVAIAALFIIFKKSA